MTKKEQDLGVSVREFLMTYGWAILCAIVVLGTLIYFDFGSIPQTDYKCLVEKFCQNQTLELENYANSNIWCKKDIMQNVSWIIEFKLDDWGTLKQIFPECEVKK